MYSQAFVDETDLTPDCRVGLPANNNAPYSADGIRLLLNAVAWAASDACGVQDRATPVSPALAPQTCSVNPADEGRHFLEATGELIDIPEGEDLEPTLSALWVRGFEHDTETETLYVGGEFELAHGSNGTFDRPGVFACDLTNGEVITSFDPPILIETERIGPCLLYTSDAADE